MIILRNKSVTKKSSAPFYSHFSLILSRIKKSSYEKKGKNDPALATELPNNKEGKLDWCECENCKKEERTVDYFCRKEVSTMKNRSIEKIEGNAKRFVFICVQEPLDFDKKNKYTILKGCSTPVSALGFLTP